MTIIFAKKKFPLFKTTSFVKRYINHFTESNVKSVIERISGDIKDVELRSAVQNFKFPIKSIINKTAGDVKNDEKSSIIQNIDQNVDKNIKVTESAIKSVIIKTAGDVRNDELRSTIQNIEFKKLGPMKPLIMYELQNAHDSKIVTNTKPRKLKRWTKEEEEFLADSLEKYGKSYFAIFETYLKQFKDESITVEKIKAKIRKIEKDKALPNNKYNTWTPEEDELLKKAVEKYGVGNWRPMVEFLPNKNFMQFTVRWDVLTKTREKVPWTPEEDNLLRELNKTLGKNHILMSEILKRPLGQIKDHFDRREWTIEETEKLKECLQKYGKDWEKIKEQFPDKQMRQIKKLVRTKTSMDPTLKKKRWNKNEETLLKEGLKKFGVG
ncbi:10646_t:CDS:2 [Diversispora eburnea]|uniref:10646_t:CDS:1 n=1 Tax=Diversispora eburnea TaxID=1213867 RepID=A0A9N9FCG5_9GLOM|nr:10646_t:CDS:2 [Diversispora eburnea]